MKTENITRFHLVIALSSPISNNINISFRWVGYATLIILFLKVVSTKIRKKIKGNSVIRKEEVLGNTKYYFNATVNVPKL